MTPRGQGTAWAAEARPEPGVEDEDLGTILHLIDHHATRTLLGAGASSLMFPGLLGGGASIWGGDGADIDDEQGWKVAF